MKNSLTIIFKGRRFNFKATNYKHHIVNLITSPSLQIFFEIFFSSPQDIFQDIFFSSDIFQDIFFSSDMPRSTPTWGSSSHAGTTWRAWDTSSCTLTGAPCPGRDSRSVSSVTPIVFYTHNTCELQQITLGDKLWQIALFPFDPEIRSLKMLHHHC